MSETSTDKKSVFEPAALGTALAGSATIFGVMLKAIWDIEGEMIKNAPKNLEKFQEKPEQYVFENGYVEACAARPISSMQRDFQSQLQTAREKSVEITTEEELQALLENIQIQPVNQQDIMQCAMERAEKNINYHLNDEQDISYIGTGATLAAALASAFFYYKAGKNYKANKQAQEENTPPQP